MKTSHFSIIINQGSGSSTQDETLHAIEGYLREHDRPYSVTVVAPGDDLTALCKPVLKKAKDIKGAVVAVGGDGTVNAVAALCSQQGVTLGIIPMGTFNYFARALGIPTDLPQALKILLEGRTRQASIGRVGEHVFLNNASFGLYKRLIEAREYHKSLFGRFRIIAFLSAIGSLFRFRKSFTVTIINRGVQERRRTMLVFVGNNTLQLDTLGLSISDCTEKGQLGVCILKYMSPLQTMLFLARGILRRLHTEPHLEQFCAEQFEVESKRAFVEVVIDGEIKRCKTPLHFSVDVGSITVFVPGAPPA